MFDKRIPDLPYNGLFPSNGLIPWYLPNDDTTYHLKGSDIIAGLMGPDDAWSPVYTYDNGDIVSDGGAVWVSNGAGNLGNPPGPASPFWTGGPPPPPPITGWPLTGSADLTGSVIINGALSYGIALGQDDDVNEISSFQAHVTDGVSGKSNIFAFPSNPGMNASNQVGTTFGSVGASQTGASIGGGDTSGSANLNVDYGNGVVASIGGSPDFDNIKNIFTFNRGSTGTTAAGFGMSFNFFAQNDMVESYEILRETFFYSDPTQNAEDSTWNVKGSNNGALVDFLNVQGGLDNQVQVFGPLKHKSYTVAGVPAAASHTASTIYVSDESGGATIAFSDGANWRRVQDRAIIS
jgi:hypothetical protein